MKPRELPRRRPPAHVRPNRPVDIVEEVALPPELAAATERDWQDLMRAMGRCHGCLDLRFDRTADGYRVSSRWQSWRDFVAWTGATIYAVVAARLSGRRVVAVESA